MNTKFDKTGAKARGSRQEWRWIEQRMSQTTERNLVLCITQLLITQGLSMCDFAFNPIYRDRFQAPIIFGYAAPIIFVLPGLSFVPGAPLYGYFIIYSIVLVLDLLFFSVMLWSITRNHKIMMCVCLLLFNFLGFMMTASEAV
jgi:hypothetical protein